MSAVFGVRLANGREVVVKARDDPAGRTPACVTAQAELVRLGIRCPAPVTGVRRVAGTALAVHAEEWQPGGELLRGESAEVAVRYACVYAELMAALEQVRVRPPLPNPDWLPFDHRGSRPWPDDAELDQLDQSLVPGFVVDTVTWAARRLNPARDLPRVLGHADFEAQNLRWTDSGTGPQLSTVFDWDSLAWMPEPVLVGAASAAFASAEVPTLVPVESSEAFLDAYQVARARAFSADELQVAWAASLLTATVNARREALLGEPRVTTAPLRAQAAERLARAGHGQRADRPSAAARPVRRRQNGPG
jgi:hypothetical protein